MDKTHNKLDESMLRPAWMTLLIENYEKEVTLAAKTPLIPCAARVPIWNICKRIDFDRYGIPGQACRLLERYIEKIYFRNVNKDTEGHDVEAYLKRIRRDLHLFIGTCVQLALKMSIRLTKRDEKLLRLILFNHRYTVQDIIKMEVEVFKALDYYIPSRTTVEVSELLAAEIQLPDIVSTKIDYVVNLAELYRPKIEEKVCWVANMTESVPICTLHFAAGGVLATVRYVGHDSLNPLAPLSRLTGASADYIKCIAGAILTQLY